MTVGCKEKDLDTVISFFFFGDHAEKKNSLTGCVHG